MPRAIPLLRGQATLVDDSDYAFVLQWRWRLNSKGYVIRSERMGGRTFIYCLHRVLMNAGRGQVVAFLKFEEAVQEVFAVVLLPGIRFPDLINDNAELVGSSFVLPDDRCAS